MFEPPNRDDVETLARWVDEDNTARYLSLYADLNDRKRRDVLEDRREEIQAVLNPERVDAFDQAFEAAVDELGPIKSKGHRGVAVFASPENDRLHAFGLAEPVTNRLVWDTSPYVRPLARFVDDYEGLAIVLVDGSQVAIHHVESARPEKVFRSSANLQGRHKKGGWSQMRYQRARETELNRFLDETIARLGRLAQEDDVDQVLVAGRGQVRDQLVNRFPHRLLERVTEVQTVDLDDWDDGELLRSLTEVGRAREAESSREATTLVLDRLARGELAVANPFEVARAARDGRAELLVVDEESNPGASKCETHDAYFEKGATCSCGSEDTPVDLANEAVEDASRSDARVEFLTDERLRQVGGVAALLRW